MGLCPFTSAEVEHVTCFFFRISRFPDFGLHASHCCIFLPKASLVLLLLVS